MQKRPTQNKKTKKVNVGSSEVLEAELRIRKYFRSCGAVILTSEYGSGSRRPLITDPAGSRSFLNILMPHEKKGVVKNVSSK
jgi:hypothetical protein